MFSEKMHLKIAAILRETCQTPKKHFPNHLRLFLYLLWPLSDNWFGTEQD